MIGIVMVGEDAVHFFDGCGQVDSSVSVAGMKFLTGRLGDIPVTAVGFRGDCDRVTLAAQLMIDRFNVTTVVLLSPGEPLVPYLQAGDLVAAERILVSDFLTAGMNDGAETPLRAITVTTIAAEIIEHATQAYETVFAGKSNRPQMIVGSALSAKRLAPDWKTAARLYRESGIVAAAPELSAVAEACRPNDIPLFILLYISDYTAKPSDAAADLSTSRAQHSGLRLLTAFLETLRAPVPVA